MPTEVGLKSKLPKVGLRSRACAPWPGDWNGCSVVYESDDAEGVERCVLRGEAGAPVAGEDRPEFIQLCNGFPRLFHALISSRKVAATGEIDFRTSLA